METDETKNDHIVPTNEQKHEDVGDNNNEIKVDVMSIHDEALMTNLETEEGDDENSNNAIKHHVEDEQLMDNILNEIDTKKNNNQMDETIDMKTNDLDKDPNVIDEKNKKLILKKIMKSTPFNIKLKGGAGKWALLKKKINN